MTAEDKAKNMQNIVKEVDEHKIRRDNEKEHQMWWKKLWVMRRKKNDSRAKE